MAMDEIVLEIETDKTAIPVMSPGHGNIVKFMVKDGQSVKSQELLFQVLAIHSLHKFSRRWSTNVLLQILFSCLSCLYKPCLFWVPLL